MAISSSGSQAIGGTGTAGTTLATGTFSAAVGDILLCFTASDNINTTDWDFSEVVSVTDQAGNLWRKVAEWTNGQGAAAGGVTVSVWLCKVRTALSTQTATVTWSGTVGDRCCRIWKFTVGAGNTLSPHTQPKVTVADGSTNPGSLTSETGASKEYLFVRAVGCELNSTADLTLTSGYSAITGNRSRSNTSSVSHRGEFRILTATASTSAPTISSACDSSSVFIAFEEVPDDVAIAEWGSMPSAAVHLRRGHSITAGLVHCWIANRPGALHDLVTGTPMTLASGATWHPYGIAFVNGSATLNAVVPDAPLISDKGLSVVWRGRLSGGANLSHMFAHKMTSWGANTPFALYGMPSGARSGLVVNRAHATQSAWWGVNIPQIPTEYPVNLVCTFEDNLLQTAPRLYVGTVPYTPTVVGGGTGAVTGGGNDIILGTSPVGHVFWGYWEYLAIWGRPLTPDEVELLHWNPYVFLAVPTLRWTRRVNSPPVLSIEPTGIASEEAIGSPTVAALGTGAIRFATTDVEKVADYLQCTTGTFPVESPFTLSFWWYIESVGTTALWYFGSAGYTQYLGIYQDETAGIRLHIEVQGVGSSGGASLSPGWHHVALTRNGSNFALYVDGSLYNSLTEDITIGTPAQMSWGAAYGGRVTASKQWAAILSADELALEAIYRAPVRLTNLSNAHAFTGPTDLADTSGNGQHFSLGQGGLGSAAGPEFVEIIATGIPSEEAIGSPKVNLTLRPAGIDSAEEIGSPTVTPGAVTIQPTGIASAEEIGSPKVNLTLRPAGIDSAEEIGSPKVNLTISPAGIASAEAIGAIQVNLTLSPDGIASAEAIGTPSVAQRLAPDGIASAEAIGSPQLNFTIRPTGIDTAEAIGSPTITTGAVTISPTGIPTAEAIGSPTVSPGAVTLSPTGIASEEAIGSPVVTPGTRTISPTGIDSAEAIGTPQLNLTILPTGIPTAEAIGSPTIIKDAIFINPTGIDSAEAIGSPTLTLGAVTLFPTGIATAEAIGVPVLTPGAVTLSPTGIASLEAIGSPMIRLWISPAGVPSAEAIGSPTLILGAVTLSPVGIASAEAFGSPTVFAGAGTILPAGIESAEAIGSPTLTPGAVTLSPTGIGSQEALGSPLIVLWVHATGIPTAEAIGAPTIHFVIFPAGIPTAEAFGSPVIGGGAVSLQPDGIPSAEAIGSLTLTLGAVTLSPVGIASAEEFGLPMIVLIIAPTGIASAETFGLPDVGQGFTLSPTGIPTAEEIGVPILRMAILPTGIPTAEEMGVPQINFTLYPTGIPEGTMFGSPVVGSTAVFPTGVDSLEEIGLPLVTGPILATGIPSTSMIGSPVIEPGGIMLEATGIPSGTTFGTPLVIAGAVVLSPTGVDTAELLGLPTLTVPVQPAGVESGEIFGTPVIDAGVTGIIAQGISSEEAFGPVVVLLAGAQVIFLDGVESVEAIGTPVIFGGFTGPGARTWPGIAGGPTWRGPRVKGPKIPVTGWRPVRV